MLSLEGIHREFYFLKRLHIPHDENHKIQVKILSRVGPLVLQFTLDNALKHRVCNAKARQQVSLRKVVRLR